MNITLHRLTTRLVREQLAAGVKTAASVQAPSSSQLQMVQARSLHTTSAHEVNKKCEQEKNMFENSRQGYSSKTTYELLRAVMVFQMCNMDTLVKYQGQVSQ